MSTMIGTHGQAGAIRTRGGTLRAAVLAGALLALPAPFAAQTPEQRIEEALARAGRSGVPLELLQSKVAEGRAKGYPSDVIARAVERRLEVLDRVRSSFGERHGLTPEELGVAADALQYGIGEDVVAALSEVSPQGRRAAAIATLTQLVGLGMASEEALQRVTQALERGPDALMNLPAQAAAARGGGPPGLPPQAGGAGAQGRGGPPATVPPAGGSMGRQNPPGRGGPPGGGGG